MDALNARAGHLIVGHTDEYGAEPLPIDSARRRSLRVAIPPQTFRATPVRRHFSTPAAVASLLLSSHAAYGRSSRIARLPASATMRSTSSSRRYHCVARSTVDSAAGTTESSPKPLGGCGNLIDARDGRGSDALAI